MSRDLNVRGFVCLLAIVCAALFAVSGCGHSSSAQIPDPEIVAPPTPDVVVEQAIDSDGDGVLDENDNCPTIVNPEQTDLDSDGIGDACDEDIDGDGVPNSTDNCVVVENPEQVDSDGDRIGLACDPVFDDADEDTIGDGRDNCPDVDNPDQADLDNDGIGDLCDDDWDNDRVLNDVDNCPWHANSEQTNTDVIVNPPGDGLGDVCDPDDDNDGILDDGDGSDTIGDNTCKAGNAANCDDNCHFVVNTDQADHPDGDGIGNVCDTDPDGDGLYGDEDNCPMVANPDQADLDKDGIGDECDDDDDGDGWADDADNCPTDWQVDQSDMDFDSIGDVCDPDIDGDGICNINVIVDGICAPGPEGGDNCPRTANFDQMNHDGDAYVPKDNTFVTDEPNKGGDVCDIDDDNDGILDEGYIDGDGHFQPATACSGYGSEDGPTGSGAQTECSDNCQFTPNWDQQDIDNDGVGSACSDDIDGDTILNPYIDANGDLVKNEGWGTCTEDITDDCYDNCAYLWNFDQKDQDNDEIGDVCDVDLDGDGFYDKGIEEGDSLFDYCPENPICH